MAVMKKFDFCDNLCFQLNAAIILYLRFILSPIEVFILFVTHKKTFVAHRQPKGYDTSYMDNS